MIIQYLESLVSCRQSYIKYLNSVKDTATAKIMSAANAETQNQIIEFKTDNDRVQRRLDAMNKKKADMVKKGKIDSAFQFMKSHEMVPDTASSEVFNANFPDFLQMNRNDQELLIDLYENSPDNDKLPWNYVNMTNSFKGKVVKNKYCSIEKQQYIIDKIEGLFATITNPKGYYQVDSFDIVKIIESELGCKVLPETIQNIIIPTLEKVREKYVKS